MGTEERRGACSGRREATLMVASEGILKAKKASVRPKGVAGRRMKDLRRQSMSWGWDETLQSGLFTGC